MCTRHNANSIVKLRSQRKNVTMCIVVSGVHQNMKSVHKSESQTLRAPTWILWLTTKQGKSQTPLNVFMAIDGRTNAGKYLSKYNDS